MATAEKATVEKIKKESQRLRGEIAQELLNDAEDVSDASAKLLKFHGTYLQDARRCSLTTRSAASRAESFGDLYHRYGVDRLREAVESAVVNA